MKILPVLLLPFLLLGCLVCRHMAMAHYGWAIEEGYSPKIVLYTTTTATQIMSGGIWNGHVAVKVGDKWVYGDPPTLHDEPEHPLGKYCWIMDMDQYMDYLKVYKDLSAQPYVERAEWPLCQSRG